MKRNLLQRILLPLSQRGRPFMGAGSFNGMAEERLKKLLSIIRFDYMGSADFEFGTIPRCLKTISEDRKYIFHQKSIKGVIFYMILPGDSVNEYIDLIEKWSEKTIILSIMV